MDILFPGHPFWNAFWGDASHLGSSVTLFGPLSYHASAY